MNYSLKQAQPAPAPKVLILLLSTMDKLLVHPTTPVSSYQYLCNTLRTACNLTSTYINDKESRWIQQRIDNVVGNHISIGNMLRLTTGRSSYDEAYYFRKYLIRRWIGEANKILSDPTSSSVVK